MPPTLTPAAFAAKWRDITTTEMAGGGDGFADGWKPVAPVVLRPLCCVCTALQPARESAAMDASQ